MSERVDALFARFVEERADGRRPDPADFIAEAGDHGEQLAAMLGAYLAVLPASVTSEAEVDELADALDLATPKPWPQLIPELRERRGLLDKQVLLDVWQALHVDSAGAQLQVQTYLNGLETGRVDPRGVRPAVVDALAAALRAPRALLEQSRWLTGPAPASPSLARLGAVSERWEMAGSVDPSPIPDRDPAIDDLFTGELGR